MEVIRCEEKERWNNIIKSFKNWDIYYLNEYAHSLELHGDGKPRTKDMHTVVKSVQLLKGKRQVNENLKLLGKDFGSSKLHAYATEGGVIEWEWDGKEKGPICGWNTKGIDFSEWSSIRIEVESTDIPVEIRMYQNGNGKECHIGYAAVSPTKLEAKLDGSMTSWTYPEGAKWDPSKGIDEIQVRAVNVTKAGLKTKIKSVTLLKAGEESKQPDLMLLGEVNFTQGKNAVQFTLSDIPGNNRTQFFTI